MQKYYDAHKSELQPTRTARSSLSTDVMKEKKLACKTLRRSEWLIAHRLHAGRLLENVADFKHSAANLTAMHETGEFTAGADPQLKGVRSLSPPLSTIDTDPHACPFQCGGFTLAFDRQTRRATPHAEGGRHENRDSAERRGDASF